MTGRASGRARGIRVAFFASFLGDARKEEPTLQLGKHMSLSKGAADFSNTAQTAPTSAPPKPPHTLFQQRIDRLHVVLRVVRQGLHAG